MHTNKRKYKRANEGAALAAARSVFFEPAILYINLYIYIYIYKQKKLIFFALVHYNANKSLQRVFYNTYYALIFLLSIQEFSLIYFLFLFVCVNRLHSYSAVCAICRQFFFVCNSLRQMHVKYAENKLDCIMTNIMLLKKDAHKGE